jgi:hypothetical protein
MGTGEPCQIVQVDYRHILKIVETEFLSLQEEFITWSTEKHQLQNTVVRFYFHVKTFD